MNTMHDVSNAIWVNYIRMYGIPTVIDRLERFVELIEARDVEGVYNFLVKGISDYLDLLEV